ncbi:hypothetical protein [Embleya sp. NBC_00896]|uniref:hypothetical protein n=1 Tax=Embleya sp. NBC_00896 TaxID=2975961 RepID=UPI00386DD29F|nr:hypothetical protein OG928_04450 [Embleya sp. NBC_00896]
MGTTTLQRIADREQAVNTAAEQVRARIDELTGRLRELATELTDLTVARKVILALGDDEPPNRPYPALPDNPAYQHILTVLADANTALRAKDPCHALDTGTEPRHIESMRAKLKRLVNAGIATENNPGLFTLTRP